MDNCIVDLCAGEAYTKTSYWICVNYAFLLLCSPIMRFSVAYIRLTAYLFIELFYKHTYTRTHTQTFFGCWAKLLLNVLLVRICHAGVVLVIIVVAAAAGSSIFIDFQIICWIWVQIARPKSCAFNLIRFFTHEYACRCWGSCWRCDFDFSHWLCVTSNWRENFTSKEFANTKIRKII